MARQAFKSFINKFVKVVYTDGTRFSIARGILVKENQRYLFLKGDYTHICILKDLVKKITCQVQGGSSEDGKQC